MSTTITKLPTIDQVKDAKGKALWTLYQVVFGRPTRNKNTTLLRDRMIKELLDRAALAAREAVKAAVATAKTTLAGEKRRRAVAKENGGDPRIPKIGTVLTRETREHGVVRCEVVDAGGKMGFRFKGAVYESLSAVAKEATGTTWNGLLFFKLISYAKRPAKTRAPAVTPA